MQTPSYPSIAKFAQLVELKDNREPTKKAYVRASAIVRTHIEAGMVDGMVAVPAPV